MRKTEIITRVDELSTGYVQIRCTAGSKYWGWAQMPKWEWDALVPGCRVPDEYIFANECPDVMPILVKEALKVAESENVQSATEEVIDG